MKFICDFCKTEMSEEDIISRSENHLKLRCPNENCSAIQTLILPDESEESVYGNVSETANELRASLRL